MGYGALNCEDVEVLEHAISKFSMIRFLEIGVHTGTTARGVYEYAKSHGASLEYWGIDPIVPELNPPFPEARFIHGFSDEVFYMIPEGFNVVLVDGCHCINHVMLDVLHYGPKVIQGGFMLFHDVCPSTQHSYPNSQALHGPDIPQFKNAVNDALKLLSFPFYPWIHVMSKWDESKPWGGMSAYLKL